MHLDNYYSANDDHIKINRQQASDFAKHVAGDFNPIHNVDAKRFCVPGDLLFALALQRYGLSQQMQVVFSGMVGDAVTLDFAHTDARTIDISDTAGKTYLHIERGGERTHDAARINQLTRCYVQFSGRTFPHILVPLMQQQQVILNPQRPFVIYENMNIDLNRLAFDAPQLELDDSTLEVKGKRGEARLHFKVLDQGAEIGSGAKNMLLSGLQAYSQEKAELLIQTYTANKAAYPTRP
jgi:hypothetical protein